MVKSGSTPIWTRKRKRQSLLGIIAVSSAKADVPTLEGKTLQVYRNIGVEFL